MKDVTETKPLLPEEETSNAETSPALRALSSHLQRYPMTTEYVPKQEQRTTDFGTENKVFNPNHFNPNAGLTAPFGSSKEDTK